MPQNSSWWVLAAYCRIEDTEVQRCWDVFRASQQARVKPYEGLCPALLFMPTSSDASSNHTMMLATQTVKTAVECSWSCPQSNWWCAICTLEPDRLGLIFLSSITYSLWDLEHPIIDKMESYLLTGCQKEERKVTHLSWCLAHHRHSVKTRYDTVIHSTVFSHSPVWDSFS